MFECAGVGGFYAGFRRMSAPVGVCQFLFLHAVLFLWLRFVVGFGTGCFDRMRAQLL